MANTTNSEIAWTIEDGVKLCRELEPHLIQIGYHVALGGSVLVSGLSKKDLDVFVYPHKSNHTMEPDLLMKHIGRLWTFERFSECTHSKYGDNKIVYFSVINGRRVDFFFVS